MSAQFPITYSKAAPSGRVGQVPMQLDTRTGAEGIGRAMQQSGEGIDRAIDTGIDIFMKVKQQEDMAEFSELKRKVDEAGYAAFNSVVGDELADSAIPERLNQTVEGLMPSGPFSGNKQRMFQQHINEELPRWNQQIEIASLAKRKQNANDKFANEFGIALESPNTEAGQKEALTILHNQLATGGISQEDFNYQVEHLPVTQALRQAAAAYKAGDFQGEAIKKLSDPEFRKTLTDKEVDWADSLVKSTGEDFDKLKRETENAAYEIMDKADEANLSSMDKRGIVESLKKELTAKGVSTREMRNYIDNWAKSEDVVTSDEIYDKLDNRITLFQTGRTDESKDVLLKDLRDARFVTKTISEADYRKQKDRIINEKELSKLNAHYLAEARALLKDVIITDLGILYGQDSEQAMEYRTVTMNLEEEVRNGKLDGKAIWDRATELAETYTKDPLGRTMETMRKYKERLKEMKERKGEEEGAPQREGVPADKIKGFLRNKGWGG